MIEFVELAKSYVGINAPEKIQLMNYYNEHCYPFVPANRKYKIQINDDWCAMFVSVIAHKAGIRDGTFPFEVSTIQMMERFRRAGQAVRGGMVQAVKGDIVFFDWNGNGVPQHVGFIASIKGGKVLTIEGNKAGTVGYRELPVNSPLILDVCRSVVLVEVEAATIGDYIQLLALNTIRGKYGNGGSRKLALGKYYSEVQERVNQILAKSEY